MGPHVCDHTVPANELVASIHDRMRAILDRENFPRSFGDDADPRELLVPYPSDALVVKEIRRRSR
jgi:putative SOS response-associated peptidase YedK